MTNRTCGTCLAFLVDDGEVVGGCQLHPPTVTESGCLFPAVNYQAWCLDWVAKEKAQKAPGEAQGRKTVYPSDFMPDARAEALAKGQGQNVHALLAEFKDHHTANRSLFSDWQAAFRKWLRQDVKFREGRR